MPVARMTRLEAVNQCLEAIGLVGVNTLAVNNILEVNLAQAKIDRTLRSVQEIGHVFNTDFGVTLSPDVNGEILLPANALRVHPTDQSLPYIERAGKLYDNVEHTYTLGKSVEVTIIYGLDFEELPEAARQYVAAQAALRFAEDQLGSDNVKEQVRRFESIARAAFEESDNDVGGYNFLSSPQEARILRRRLV